MSGGRTAPPQSITEFSQYLAHEKAKTIPIEPYQLGNSLRVWIIQFEQQATVHGIEDFNIVATQLSRYLPVVIQQWIPILPVNVRTNYSLLREALLNRFAMAEEEENRILLRQLKQCKKDPKESIRLHAARWEHLLSLTVAVKIGRMFSYFAYTHYLLLHFLVYSNEIYFIRKSKLCTIIW
ncbi:hypothetical protein G6F43_012245 [Rhizopus delemar]|nr:hypothetical protein G6F43_012245 [Rhizopus delemar]